MRKRFAITLADILEVIGLIELQCSGLEKDQFLDSPDVKDATSYRFLAIGEFARSLPDAFKGQYPEIPWHRIVSMRNLLAHEYFAREGEILWKAVGSDLPELKAVCEAGLRDNPLA